MDAKTRKTAINLITLGTGVIFFGIWTLVKSLVSFILLDAELHENLTEEMILFTKIFFWALIAVSFILNLYVGLSARALGKGKNKSSFFLVVAGIIVFFRSIIAAIELIGAFLDYGDTINLIITAFIDITTIVFLVELMVYSIRLKKIRKAETAKEAEYEL